MKAFNGCLLLSLAVLAQPLFGQGSVLFLNGQITFATTADRLVYVCGTGVGTNFAVALFYAPGADQWSILSGGTMALGSNSLGLAFLRPPTTVTPGVWRNPPEVGNFRTLVGVLPGEIATLQVRVWDYAKYQTFAAAYAAGAYSGSQPFNYMVPADGSPASAYYMEGLRAWAPTSLDPSCPEPSVLALVGVGVTGLAWRLRQRGRGRT